MKHAPSEDLHNSPLASQDLAFFEEIPKKASHDLTVMMTLKVVKLRLKYVKIISQNLILIHFFTQQVISFV